MAVEYFGQLPPWILAPVSQSGGIGTGGVIERGSNANGEYVRFADGTQICWSVLTASAINIADGSIFRSDVTTWTFPAVFSVAPVVWAAARDSTIWANPGGPSISAVALRLFRAVSTAGTPSVAGASIGRWF